VKTNAVYSRLCAKAGHPIGAPALGCESCDQRRQNVRRTEGFSRLDQALAALSAELRECLVLRELEGLAYKEIAKITGVPTGTVMSLLWRARKTLLHMSVCEADSNSAPKPAQPSLVDHGRH
jgi:RNA polymerase sigma factor (sigma-70 family)